MLICVRVTANCWAPRIYNSSRDSSRDSRRDSSRDSRRDSSRDSRDSRRYSSRDSRDSSSLVHLQEALELLEAVLDELVQHLGNYVCEK